MKKSIYILFIVAIGILLFIPDIANAESVGVFSDVQDRFEQAVSRTSTTITNQANWLFWVLAAISLVWTGITLVFRKGDISDFFAEFIRFIIFIGFFNWLLNNGHQMAKDILSSFSTLGSSAIGESDTLNPSGIMDIGFNLWERTYPSVSELSLKQIIPAYLIVIAVVIIVGLIAVNVLLLNVSAWIFAYAGVFVLGFGGSRWTSDIAISYFKQLLNLGLQILSMIIIVGIGKTFISVMLDKVSTFIFFDFVVILLCVIVLLYLVNKIPPMVGSLAGGFGNGGAGMLGGGAAMAAMAMTGGALMGAATALKAAGMEMAGAAKAFSAAKKGGDDSNKKDSAIDAVKGGNSGDNSSAQDGKPLTSEAGESTSESNKSETTSSGNTGTNNNDSSPSGETASTSSSEGATSSNNGSNDGSASNDATGSSEENTISSGSASSNSGDTASSESKSNTSENTSSSSVGENGSSSSETSQATSDSSSNKGSGEDTNQIASTVPKTTNTGGESPLAAAMGGNKVSNWQAAKKVVGGLVKNKWNNAIDNTAGGRLANQWKNSEGDDNA